MPVNPRAPAILSRDVLLDLIAFIHLERDEAVEMPTFPRFQQLDAVRRSSPTPVSTGRETISSSTCRVRKVDTIAWIAHQIINLHDDADQPLFDTAIIVTDRLVPDRQLQTPSAGLPVSRWCARSTDLP